MDPSAYMQYQPPVGLKKYQFINNDSLSQSTKSFMDQQCFQLLPESSHGSIQDLNKGLLALNLDSVTLKKLSQSGIKDFIPQQSPLIDTADLHSSNRVQSRLQQQPRPLRHPTGPASYSSYPSDRMSTLGAYHSSSSLGKSPKETSDLLGRSNIGGIEPEQSPNFEAYNEGGTTYYISGAEMAMGDSSAVQGRQLTASIPNFSIYVESPIEKALKKMQNDAPKQLVNNDYKLELLKRHYICLAELDIKGGSEALPSVETFQNLVPLENLHQMSMSKSSSFGYQSSVYKADNTTNGTYACLHRIHGFRLVNTKCMGLVDQWKKLKHANVVTLRQVFTSKAFGDHSIIFVYDFYAGAQTLMSKYLNSSPKAGNAYMDPYRSADNPRSYFQQKNSIMRSQPMSGQTGFLPESLLWNFVIQLTSALRHIHSASLACRSLDPTKVLITGGPSPRLLLNCCGISDVLNYEATCSNPMAAIVHYQQEDLVQLGKIILALACQSVASVQRENLQASIEVASSTYSKDLRSLLLYLLTSPARMKSINDLMPMIGARFYNQLDIVNKVQDSLEEEFVREVESSRLFGLLTKLCTVVDRGDQGEDESWSEYGDCYMLKLFRDYVFHQVMDDSRPWLDMAHVISNLNKLDAGVSDKITLMSRDEQNVLVVSYEELKKCLDQAFGECVHSTRKYHTG